jgi:predicted dehydrogenase
MNGIMYGKGYWAGILKRYLDSKDVKIIGIVDTHTTFQEEKELLEKAEVAFICTPVNTHYEIAKKLLNRGIHVFCEKMLTLDSESSIELINLSLKNKCVLFVDYTYLYSPGINNIKKNLYQIGNIKLIRGSIKQYGKFYEDCNVMQNIGCHFLAIIHYVTEWEKMDIIVKNYNGILEDYDYCFQAKKNNSHILLNASLLSNYKTREIEFIGDRGILSYNMLSNNTVSFIDYYDQSKNYTVKFNESNNLRYSVDKFFGFIFERDLEALKQNQSIVITVSNEINK